MTHRPPARPDHPEATPDRAAARPGPVAHPTRPHGITRYPDRRPYVGDGADGARRSAEIDRSEADGLDRTDPRRDELLASAHRWDQQAARLDAPTDGDG